MSEWPAHSIATAFGVAAAVCSNSWWRHASSAYLCAVWFHPLAWLTSSRLALYRELSCDESVADRALGGDLVRALGKLARPGHGAFLQATASSFMSDRLALLRSDRPARTGLLVDVALGAIFAGVLLLAVLETISHTACCFVPVT